MSRRKQNVAVIATLILLVVAMGCCYWRHTFPFGYSHCCDKGLYLSLKQYAETHGGWFPRGEVSPEASLSLIHWESEYGEAEVLRGKTVRRAAVDRMLDNGQPLTPETCGWHYVEGLRLDDDSKLALFWDKAGLGHNGQRLKGGGHQVMFVNWWVEHIPEDRWPQFLEEQRALRAALNRPTRASIDRDDTAGK